MASPCKQVLHRFAGEVVDDVETPVAVWRPGVVAQVQILVFREASPYFFQYGKSPYPESNTPIFPGFSFGVLIVCQVCLLRREAVCLP